MVIPTYQEEATIEACLESIRRQTFDRSQYEIVVADSSSTDSTATIARTLGATVVTTDKRGIGLGRNLGAGHGSGEYLLFVDADVRLLPDFLTRMDEAIRAQHLVCATGIGVPSDGRMIQRFVYRATYRLAQFLAQMGMHLYPGLCFCCARKEFERVGGFREDLAVAEDLDLSRRFARIGRCAVVPEARALVSTRRLDQNAFSTVLFHIINDLRYLLTGKGAKFYPKVEDARRKSDLWRAR